MEGAIISAIKRKIRLIQLVEAAERAALAPIEGDKLHALAYLADVLSPVWGLIAFDQRVLKTGRPPVFPDLQREIEKLVCMGIFEVSCLSYVRAVDGSMTFRAKYAIRFASNHGQQIRAALDADSSAQEQQLYFDELARAMASLNDDDIAFAAAEDVVYDDPKISSGDIIVFGDTLSRERMQQTTLSFERLFPHANLTRSRQLYMYAHYLGRKIHAAA